MPRQVPKCPTWIGPVLVVKGRRLDFRRQDFDQARDGRVLGDFAFSRFWNARSSRRSWLAALRSAGGMRSRISISDRI